MKNPSNCRCRLSLLLFLATLAFSCDPGSAEAQAIPLPTPPASMKPVTVWSAPNTFTVANWDLTHNQPALFIANTVKSLEVMPRFYVLGDLFTGTDIQWKSQPSRDILGMGVHAVYLLGKGWFVGLGGSLVGTASKPTGVLGGVTFGKTVTF